MSTYDYIIIGAGASGLLLADAMSKDPFFKTMNILLLDKSDKKENDRTWCFWEKDKGDFEAILNATWPKIHFAGAHIDQKYRIGPYGYKMVRGLGFYNHYLNKIQQCANIDFVVDAVVSLEQHDGQLELIGQKNTYVAHRVLDSRFDYQKLFLQHDYPVLQQHFLGWFVKTDKAVFDMEAATFMDFSIPQKGNTRFMYVLPLSPTEALVEYTLFSEQLLEKSSYEDAIKAYLTQKFQVDDYEILEVEQGNIPMTCFDFTTENSANYLKIGTAGGWAKPSTGYTFYNSTKKVKKLVAHLKTGRPLERFHKKTRFWYYDLLLLDILKRHNEMGRTIFESIFKKRSPQLILKFLDEDTNLWEELKIITACPKLPFLKALLRRAFKPFAP